MVSVSDILYYEIYNMYGVYLQSMYVQMWIEKDRIQVLITPYQLLTQFQWKIMNGDCSFT